MGTGGCCGVPVDYGPRIFLAQAEELLTHILKPGEIVDLWVGHSTGGLVGMYVAETGVWPVRTFGMVSPAFWLHKPALAWLWSYGFFKRMVANNKTIGAGLLENNDKAFAKGKNGAYLFPEQHKKDAEKIKNIFEHHPQAGRACAGILAEFLRFDMMVEHRSHLKALLTRDDGPKKVVLVWGNGDIVCPCEFAAEVVAMNPKCVQLVSPNLGHEALSEDPTTVAKAIVEGLKDVHA